MKWHVSTNLLYKLISLVLIKVRNENHIIYLIHTINIILLSLLSELNIIKYTHFIKYENYIQTNKLNSFNDFVFRFSIYMKSVDIKC